MDNESPWRQPVVWLMVALVAAAVIGGVVMVRVAGGDGSVDAVPDDVQRTGQAQQADLGPDQRAAARKLSAVLRIDAKGGFVEVVAVSGDFDRAARMRLRLHHPLRAADDRVLELAPGGAGWRADARPAGNHDWNLQLEPADDAGAWRLLGRLPRGQLAARLHPALDDADDADDETPDDAPGDAQP
jgi:hypothetical protein